MKHNLTPYNDYQRTKERNCLAELENAKNEIQDRAIKLAFPIKAPLIVDGARHIQNKGLHNKLSYIASFHKNEIGNTFLHCSIGFTEIGKQWDIAVPIKEIRIKKK